MPLCHSLRGILPSHENRTENPLFRHAYTFRETPKNRKNSEPVENGELESNVKGITTNEGVILQQNAWCYQIPCKIPYEFPLCRIRQNAVQS